MVSFLGIVPRPIDKTGADDWDVQFNKNMIERDGFVHERHRYEF